jgi:hypothetical protein
MTKISNYILAVIGFAVLVMGIYLYTPIQNSLGESFSGTATNVRIATTTVVGPQGASVVKTQIFAGNVDCNSRIITTDGTSAIRISFKDIPGAGNVGSTTVGATVGAIQLASTTVEYDSGIYGCGVWNAWAWASTTLTLTETQ